MNPNKIIQTGNLAVLDYNSGEVDIYNIVPDLLYEDIEVFLSDLYNLDEIEWMYSSNDKIDLNIYESR